MSIYDADDEHDRMLWALAALEDAAKLVHDRAAVYDLWFGRVIDSMYHRDREWWSWRRHVTHAARRTMWDIHLSL